MSMLVRQCLKFNSVMLAALLVTFTLFYLMQLLIRSDDGRAREAFVIPIIDATMPIIDIVLFPPLERPEPIVATEPASPPEDDRKPYIGPGSVTDFFPTIVEVDAPRTIRLTIENSSMIPLVRAIPPYPSRALQRGIEGFVLVSFTVNEMGNVINPVVTYAEPEGYFERAALQTIVKWKYAAKIENGNSVPVYGVQQRIVFNMRD